MWSWNPTTIKPTDDPVWVWGPGFSKPRLAVYVPWVRPTPWLDAVERDRDGDREDILGVTHWTVCQVPTPPEDISGSDH